MFDPQIYLFVVTAVSFYKTYSSHYGGPGSELERWTVVSAVENVLETGVVVTQSNLVNFL